MESLEERRRREALEAEERERKLREIEAMRGRKVRREKERVRECPLTRSIFPEQFWFVSPGLLHEDH